MKPDATEIVSFLDDLERKSWLGPVRKIWTRYIFHHTDIHNIVKILETGRLLSRERLRKISGMPVDNASRTIILGTDSEVKSYVRLYFRPRNPTQYRNEGARPLEKRWEASHCPVPIFLLFDSREILTREDCLFSEGNLAALGMQGLHSTAAELSAFDFKKIYHDSPHDSDKNITHHKNAEVVFPNELNLSSLKYIVCRSPAERESLLNLLPREILNRWSSQIVIDTKINFFFRKWSYIQTVELMANYVALNFSLDTIEPGPFHLMVKRKGKETKTFQKQDFYANKQVVFKFAPNDFTYTIEVELDKNLIYCGRYDGGDEIPF